MQEKSFDIPLHDIKPIVDVQEYSFYYLLGIIGVSVVVLIGLSYLLYLWYKKRTSFNLRVHHAQLLNELDLKDTKNSAYSISNYGYTFKDDSPRHTEMFNNLSSRLQEYKYQKNVEQFDDEVLGYIELFKGMIDV